ncbi:MAG: hypothetical protein J6I50_02200 [Clostridia bacterium]|nr:hypothetical protein [Clostridia bacterium]
MKKRNFTLLLAALIVSSSMFSCAGSNDTDKDSQNTSAENNTSAIVDTTVNTTEDAVTTETETTNANTPAALLCTAFKDYVAENPDAAANDIATALSQNEIIPFGPVVQPMQEGYLPGFDADITGFTECAAFMPMIGSIPFVGYVFTVDEANVDTFKETLTAHHDLRWNICTEADEMVCDSVGNKVFFVMATNSFDE